MHYLSAPSPLPFVPAAAVAEPVTCSKSKLKYSSPDNDMAADLLGKLASALGHEVR